MTKLLNLDDIAVDSERTVKYKGQTYKVIDFDVEQFIQFQKHFTAFRTAYNSTNEDDLPKVLASTIELTKLGVPDFPIEEVARLNPLQMMALVSMIANLIPTGDSSEVVTDEKKEGPAT